MTRMDDYGKSHTGRRYAGLDASDRAQRRRRSLLSAALELFGTRSYAASSVSQICAQAQLSERYFYESFSNKENLLLQLYRELTEELMSVTMAAIETVEDRHARAVKGLDAFTRNLLDDPRRGQVVLVEVVGVSPTLESVRNAQLRRFAEDVVRPLFLKPQPPPDTHNTLMATALVGAVNNVLSDSLMNNPDPDIAALNRVCVQLFDAAYAQSG